MSLFKSLGLVNDKDKPKQEESFVENPRTTFPSNHFIGSLNEDWIKNNKEIINTSFDNIATDKDENPYLDTLRQKYNEQFVKLNKPDVDFFEIFQGLSKFGNLDSSEALKMALSMTSGNLTKEILDSQANQYAKSIMDSFETVKKQGEDKLFSIEDTFKKEKTDLDLNISNMESHLNQLKAQRDNINTKYDPQIKEIKLKSEANLIAYNELMDKISKVQKNINTNL